MKKLYYLMIMSVLFSSCSLIISDEDGDGVSNGSRFITAVYESREVSSFYFLVGGLKSGSASSLKWYVGDDPIELDTRYVPDVERLLIKNNVTYKWIKTSDNKKYSIYQIVSSGTDHNKYVVMAVEAIPIFDEDPAVLLISKTTFANENDARAYGVANEIPKLSITIPFLDLVFDPDTLVMEDHNMVEHLAAIKDGYTLLEIFSSKTLEEKEDLLTEYGYHVLLL